MSTPISGQAPAVVLRSRYVRMRTLLAIAVAATAALAITLVLVVAISGGNSTVADSSAAPSIQNGAASEAYRDASTACGVHYWGGTLVQGPPCPDSGTSR
jgi:hypothetical protein